MKTRVCWSGVVFFFCAVVHAEEFTATLVRVVDGKVTFSRGSGRKKKEYTFASDEKCRVFVAKHDAKAKTIEAGDEIAGGLKNPLFEKLAPATVGAWIRTNGDNDRIVELRLYQSAKKKDK